MKCAKIRESLTDYLRGRTDPQTTAAVTGHLGVCDGCARELAFLKAYYANIGSLEMVKAPDNFLVSVKQRLEQTGDGGSMSPWYSKLGVGKMLRISRAPQIVAVLTVALVVFLAFNPFRLGQQIRQEAKEPSAASQESRLTIQKDESEEMVTFGSDQPQSQIALAPVGENRTGDTGGAVNGVGSSDADFSDGGGGQTIGERRLILTVQEPALMAKKGLSASGEEAGDHARNETGETDQKIISEKSVLKKDQETPNSNSAMFLAVTKLIKSVNGEIMQEEPGEENGQFSLLIRIPVQNYALFLEKLREIGSLTSEGSEGPLPSKTPAQPDYSQFVEARLILKGVF